MKLKQKMIMKIFIKTKICSILVIMPEFFDPVNNKVIGKMKDEFKGKVISEFFGLKSMMYSLIDVDSKEFKKEKVVNKNVLKKIRHKKFVDVLFNKNIIRYKMKEFKVN